MIIDICDGFDTDRFTRNKVPSGQNSSSRVVDIVCNGSADDLPVREHPVAIWRIIGMVVRSEQPSHHIPSAKVVIGGHDVIVLAVNDRSPCTCR